MANTKLHIICGNCGCNNEFTYQIMDDEDLNADPFQRVIIICNNCHTIHDVLDNAKPEK